MVLQELRTDKKQSIMPQIWKLQTYYLNLKIIMSSTFLVYLIIKTCLCTTRHQKGYMCSTRGSQITTHGHNTTRKCSCLERWWKRTEPQSNKINQLINQVAAQEKHGQGWVYFQYHKSSQHILPPTTNFASLCTGFKQINRTSKKPVIYYNVILNSIERLKGPY